MIKSLFLWVLLLPFQTVLILLFGLAEAARLLGKPFRQKAEDQPAPNTECCSIVVLNWNGRHLLEESLPALQEAVLSTGKAYEILVVDNGSNDDSLEWIREHFPLVTVLALPENLGFGEGNNRGVEAAQHDCVVLLNNDIIVSRDFLPPLLEGLRDPSVFAVSSQVIFPEAKRREETGNTQLRFKWGYPQFSHDPVEPYHYARRYLPVLWAGGGASAFHRERFLELGGFSPLFSPCYFEDTDLSARAWRRGWKVLFSPESVVLHKHRSSSSVRFEADRLTALIEQRKLWYSWRNFNLRALWAHFALLPLHIGKGTLRLYCYLSALRKLPSVLIFRLREPSHRFGLRTVLQWTRHPLEYLNRFHPDRARLSRLPDGTLRVLMVTAYLPHLGYHGGAGRAFQLLFRTSLKHRVSLLTFIESDGEAGRIHQVAPHCQRLESVFRREFEPVSYFPYEPFEEFNSPAMRQALTRLLLNEDFDLIQFEWTQMAQYADLTRGIPSFLTETEVNYAAHYSQVKVAGGWLAKTRKLYNALQTFYRELELCRKVDGVICVTDTDRDYLRGYLPENRLHVVNTGVDTEYFRECASVPGEEDALVFVAAFRHEPNVDAMLYFTERVFPLILKERPKARLYLVGSSPPPSITALSSHPNITVTGFVEDMREYYRRASAVVVPVRTGVGIRGKILEAWAAGRPVVATSVACMGIRASHGENAFIADAPEDFAMWTLALLRNPEFGRRMGEAGRLTATQFYDWSEIGRQLIQLYESTVPTQHRKSAEMAVEGR
jgi:GT2 family glycosyltransferase/glycosyltransferase involved in cell wall biosynthesis